MTAADLRAVADVLDRLAAAGFEVAVEFDGDLIIRAKPTAPAVLGEADAALLALPTTCGGTRRTHDIAA